MISWVSPVIFHVKWTKIVDFARSSVFGRKMAKNFFKNPVSTFHYCLF